MTKISGLVKKVSPDMWPIIGLMVTGWIVVALTAYLTLTLLQGIAILIVAFFLAWTARQKIRWGRYSQDTPARAKVTWLAFELIGLLGAIVIVALAVVSRINEQPLYTTVLIVLAGVIIWFAIGFVVVAIGFVPIMLKKKKEEQEKHS